MPSWTAPQTPPRRPRAGTAPQQTGKTRQHQGDRVLTVPAASAASPGMNHLGRTLQASAAPMAAGAFCRMSTPSMHPPPAPQGLPVKILGQGWAMSLGTQIRLKTRFEPVFEVLVACIDSFAVPRHVLHADATAAVLSRSKVTDHQKLLG